jgi:hypothetical protein
MNTVKKQFLRKWILAIGISWPIGLIAAIILSETIVNFFYPKETNLIVGLCIGGATGFAQWYVLKKSFHISSWWILASAIGIGVPMGFMVILHELEVVLPTPLDNENVSLIVVSCFAGLFTGLLQFSMLKPISKHASRWIIISLICWFLTMLPALFIEGFIFVIGGVILGILTGYSFLWFLKPQEVSLD